MDPRKSFLTELVIYLDIFLVIPIQSFPASKGFPAVSLKELWASKGLRARAGHMAKYVCPIQAF